MTEIRSVFVSSVIRGYETEREIARRAIESLRLTPVMSETLGASAGSPREALLDEVAGADAYLLLMFERNGEPDESRTSPTEQEFLRAEELDRPIVALVQEGELEPRQQELLARVRGQWGEGHLTGSFTAASDLQDEIVRGLTNLRRSQEAGGDELPAAREYAVNLARGDDRGGTYSSSGQARIAFAPASGKVFLDALALEDADLEGELADAARQTGLVPHSVGLETARSREGIRMSGSHPQERESIELVVFADGALTVEGPVAGAGNFGSMRIEPDRVEQLIRDASAFALRVWERIDSRGDIRRVGSAIAALEANGKVFGPAPEGSSLTVGGSMTLPAVVVAPEDGLGLARSEVASEETARRLLAELRAIFRDAGAVTD
jgi:hypothetical protein